MDTQLLLTVLVMLMGSGAFLRLVAKEKRRRERYLQIRLEEMLKELKKRREPDKGQESRKAGESTET